ncbi:MAG: tetratricopeptide repeat protein [Bacteroidetes bacterium]|nr:tetratricopeptide repeat protein [Bacteroidota bacterium]
MNNLKYYYVLVLFFTFLSVKVISQNYATICNTGLALENAGSIDAAINKYSDAIGLKPNISKAYIYRAKAYYLKANYDDAITDFSTALLLTPGDNSLYELRAKCYLGKDVYDKALTDYNKALSEINKNDTKYFLTFFNRGKALYYSKRYEDAIIDFTQSIILGKKDIKNTANISSTTNIYYWRGLSYFESSNFAEAIKDFDSYLAVYPNYVKALFYQGLSYKKNGATEKAKEIALKIIELDPSKEIYFSGEHLLDLYDLEKRREIVKQSLKDAIANIEEYKISPSQTLANKNLADAFTELDKAWLHSTGMGKADLDSRDTILKYIFKVYPLMSEKPELPELARKYMVQANIATEEKKYSDAVELFNKALSIAPYEPVSYLNRALLKEILLNYKGAIADAKKYIELYPDASNARTAQDKIYEWEGKAKTAAATYTPSISNIVNQNPSLRNTNNSGSAKAQFIMRAGLIMPKGVFAYIPVLNNPMLNSPKFNNNADSTYLKNGNMGAKSGIFFEAGVGLKFSEEASKVQFFYNPIILSYSKINMNWDIGSKIFVYKKNLRMIEVAQRYGIGFMPVPKFLMAVYYRPGLVIPLDFNVSYSDSTVYSVNGTMGIKGSALMMSHTFGFTIGYSFVSLSFESYFARPTFDVNINNMGVASKYTVKIPFRTNRIGIALSF